MPGIEWEEPSKEQIQTIRKKAKEKFDELGLENFSPRDIDRLNTSDAYVSRFFMHVFDHPGKQEEEAVTLILQAFKWRKEFGAEDINAENVNKAFFEKGALWSHNRDKDGKKLLVLEIRKHQKGEEKMEEVKKFFIYYLEKLEKEEKGERITILFDCSNCGLKNLDMEFVQFIISSFQDFYPWMLNWILVFGMPWILNPAWKIIKGWLPPAGAKLIKFINKNNITEFIDESNALEAYGGSDPWVYSYDSEETSPPEYSSPLHQDINKNEINRKKSVTFPSEPTSPESAPLQDGKPLSQDSILRLIPGEEVIFTSSTSDDLMARLQIINVSSQTAAFKIKTTSPEKYRVRPSIGLLLPGDTASIEIQVANAYSANAASLVRDKFLVTAMYLDEGNLSNQQLQEAFKAGPLGEKFTLRCVLSADHFMGPLSPLMKYPINSPALGSDKQIEGLIKRVNRLADQNEELASQLITCHWIQTGLLMMILCVVLYIGWNIPFITEPDIVSTLPHTSAIPQENV